MPRKISLMCAASSPMPDGKGVYEVVFATADDGTVWEYRNVIGGSTSVTGQNEWRKIPSLPQDGSPSTRLKVNQA